MSEFGDIARDYFERGGKRLRPRLCRAVFERLGGAGDLAPVCDAVEAFHKASLVHDDIQDGDETRYGRPALHVQVGVPLAIAVGDGLVARGYAALAASGFARVKDMLAATAFSHCRLCEGQGDELLLLRDLAAAEMDFAKVPRFTRAAVLSIYERKTGEAFALAAQLGALAADAPDEVVAAARRFGLAYGVAFQIADDLGDGGHFLLDACGGDRALVEAARREALGKATYENETTLHCDLGPFGLR